MEKLIAQYIADRSVKNAEKIRKHDLRHPMSRCILTADEALIVAEAIRVATL